MHDTIKGYLLGQKAPIAPDALEVLRLIYIAENREHLLKSVESLELGVKCSDVSYSSDQNDRVN